MKNSFFRRLIAAVAAGMMLFSSMSFGEDGFYATPSDLREEIPKESPGREPAEREVTLQESLKVTGEVTEETNPYRIRVTVDQQSRVMVLLEADHPVKAQITHEQSGKTESLQKAEPETPLDDSGEVWLYRKAPCELEKGSWLIQISREEERLTRFTLRVVDENVWLLEQHGQDDGAADTEITGETEETSEGDGEEEETAETPDEAGAEEETIEVSEEAGGEEAADETAEEAGGEEAADETAEEAGGEEETDETAEEAGGEEKADGTVEEAGEEEEADETAEEADETAEEAGGEEEADETAEEAGADSEEPAAEEQTEVYYPGTLEYRGADYRITVSYGPEACFPEGTEIRVKEILPGTAQYAELSGQAETALAAGEEKFIEYERYFDISFVYNGEETEPRAPIDVLITFDDVIPSTGNDTIEAIHFSEDGPETIQAETQSLEAAAGDSGAIDTVVFSADTFSVYGVVRTSRVRILDARGEAYIIEVEYGPEAHIPDDAELTAEEILPGSEQYEDYRQQAAAALNADGVFLTGLYDISIRQGGEKIPFDGSVRVSIHLEEEIPNAEQLQVVHFSEETETVDASVEGSTVSFSADGFSVYGLAFTVDFSYQGYEFRLGGNKWITLSDLLTRLNVTDRNTQAPLNMADIERVVFTDPSLVPAEAVTEDTTLAALKEKAGLEVKDGDEAVDIAAPDWVLFSANPFTTREKLAVITRDGETYVIEVTDAIREFPNPVAVTLGVQAQLSATTDERYFSLSAPYDHQYKFEFSNLSSSTTYKYTFTLYDEDGYEIDKQEFSGAIIFSPTWELEGDSTYYIGVVRSSSSKNTRLTVSLVEHNISEETHACVQCGYLDPWYIEDGVLHIQSDEAMNFSGISASPWYSRRNEITSIVVEEGVTTIPGGFVGSSSTTVYYPNLTSVTLADTVTSIQTDSFRNCKSLQHLELGTGLKTIPSSAFYGCTGLQDVNLENVTSIGSSAFQNCTSLREVNFGDGLTTIGSSAFYGCTSISEVTIPGSVSSIGSRAFYSCTGLESAAFAEENLMTSLPSEIFRNCTSLASVTLPQDLSTIGSSAFYGCASLPEISFPSSLEKIGDSAFQGCTGLGEADLPPYLSEIENAAFRNCSSLGEVQFPSTLNKIGNQAYMGCASLGTVSVPSNVTTIGTEVFRDCTGLEEASLGDTRITRLPDYTFSGCTALTNVLIPDTVTEIGASALNSCASLTEVNFPGDITYIGNSAFSECQKLAVFNGGNAGELVIPDTVTTIGSSAFQNCDAFVSVVVPDAVTSLGASAFANCDNLETAEIGAGVDQIPASIFYNDPKLWSVVFKGNIEEIPNSAFYGCKSLQHFPLWEGLKRIGNSAFQNCTALEPVIEFPSTLESIGTSAYEGCSQLTELQFADGEQPLTIGNRAFYSIPNLRTVNLPENLTSIGSYAFYYCYAVERFDLPDNVKTIGDYAFYNCSNTKFSDMPASLETIGTYAFYNCAQLTELDFPASLKTIGNSAFRASAASNGNIARVTFAEGCELTSIGTYAFQYQDNITELVLPDKLQSIGNYAFRYCPGLESVVLPDSGSLKSIGNNAFYGDSKLKEIVIPDSVTSIGTSCFSTCSALTDVRLSEGLTSIPNSAFNSCTSLKEIDIPDGVTSIGSSAFAGCSNLESVDFPENLTSINTYAFQNCVRLEEAVLPDRVTTIYSQAFYGCTELETVRIPPAINSISSDAFNNCKSLENLIWDVPSTAITLPAMSNVPEFTLTIGKPVETLPAATLSGLVGKGARLLVFEGENHLTLPATSGLNLPRPQNSLEAGDYYADANGALYQIKDGEATLVYVPDGLTEYTIPATVPAADGTPVPVTGVKDNTFALAQSLTSVTVSNPEGITRMDPFAFAYASNLESVNGETTVAGALALFTGAEPGTQVFYGTKLTDRIVSRPGTLTYDAVNNGEDRDRGWSDTLVVSISSSTATFRGADGKRDNRGPMDTDEETKAFLAYTGEEVVTTITVSNNASSAVSGGDKVRVYFQIDDGGGLNYPPGKYSADLIRGNESVGKVDVTVCQTDAKGVFYVEFDRPGNGLTVSLDVKTNFPSPTSGGGDAVIWAEYFSGEEAAQTAGKARPPMEKNQSVNWTTCRNEFTETKTAESGTTTVTTDASGRAYIGSKSFTINLKRTGNALEKVGHDNMKSADFTDKFELPEGVYLNPTIIDEIRNNRLLYSGSGSSVMTVTSPTLGTIFRFSEYGNTAQDRVPVLSVDDGNRLCITWRVVNPNPNYNESGTEIAEHRMTMTVSNRVFYIDDHNQGNKDYTIKNTLEITEHFCYSEDITEHAEASYTVNSGSANLEMTKKGTSGKRRGESAPYTISLNSTGVLPVTVAELTKLRDVIDSSDKMHYIDANGIWYMFHEGKYPEALTLTIGNATLYGGAGSTALAGAKKTVLTTDAETAVTDQENTGYETHYNGRSGTDQYALKNNTFLFTLEEGALRYELKNSGGTVIDSGTVASADALQAMFDAHGFYVTDQTIYTVEWDFAGRVPDLQILPGQKVDILIPARVKDTFMRLTGDKLESDSDYYSSSHSYSNTATATYNGTGKNVQVTGITHQNDVSLSKGRSVIESHPYTDEYTSLEVPDVVEYSVSTTHYGSTVYDVMPVTDHMTRKQMMLVPVAENEGRPWAEGLEIRTVNHTDYYVLNREGTYETVWTGNAWADHIEVSGNDSEGYDTQICWYIRNYGGNRTYRLAYKAAAIQNEVIPLTNAYDLYNETWLGDHESHRLWDWVTDYGIYQTEPLVLEWGKRIVERVGDTSAGTDFCPVTRGKQVIYRLTFRNDRRKDFTITGADFYDVLPQTSNAHQWSKANIRLEYRGFETNDPDGTKWNIVTHSSGSREQKIKWDDDFTMTCTDPNGIAYIYVIADFPDGTAWEDYVQTYQNGTLYNKLFFRNDHLNFLSQTVSHVLADKMNIRLQKGVYATGGETVNNGSTADVYNSGEDARFVYENNDTMRRKVYYYITLHNDSYTNLYLNPIQDVLPEGFTFVRASVTDNSYASVTRGSGPAVKYVYAYYSKVDVSQSVTEDGRQRITLTLQPYTSSNTKQEDTRVGKYYLTPGQAMVIRVECYTNEMEETPERAVNRTAMPYYDLYNQGADISSGTATASGSGKKNDGNCELLDTLEAGGMGFVTDGASAATEWLYSEVTVTRGEIGPALLKSLLKKITINSDGQETAENNPTSINPTDRLVWGVTAYDNSVNSITDYAITDDLPSPFNFSGEVTFRQVFSNGSTSGDITLFHVIRETTETANGGIVATDTVTLKHNLSDTGVTLTIGGEPAVIRIPNTNNLTKAQKPELTIQVSMSYREGNEVMSIRFMDVELCVPASGKVVLEYESANLSGVLQNKLLVNTAFVTPLQQTWDGSTNEGNVTRYQTPYSADYTQSVRNSAQIVASYGGITTSKKSVREKPRPANRTNSDEQIKYITLYEAESEFIYDLSVTNKNVQPISKIVLIDNLPEKGDHSVFQDDDPRYSDFAVHLTGEPGFALTVTDENGNTKSGAELDGYYTVELSTRTEFGDADWRGDPADDWHRLEDMTPEEIRNARSIRLVFIDPAEDYYSNIFLPEATINLSFTAAIDTDDPGALAGKTAWNGFGYHFTIQGRLIDQEAAPLLTGVRIPDYPRISKTLINTRLNPYTAERDETFTYIVYEGSRISNLGTTRDAMIRTIENSRRNYVIVDVSVPRGSTGSSEPASLNDRTGRMWNSAAGRYEDRPWRMTNNAAYQVAEIPAERYTARSFNGTSGTVYSFTYTANNDAYTIASVNMHDDWSLKIRKTDQFGTPVGGAVFAVYTPVEGETWLQELDEENGFEPAYTPEQLQARYDEKTPEELNEAFGTALEQKPAYAIEQGGSQYRLMTILRTPGHGIVQLDELTGEHYLYRELQAPEHYEPDPELHTVDMGANGAVITVTPVNQYKANGSARISALKQLAGRPLKAGEFTFRLEGFDIETGTAYSPEDPLNPPMPAENPAVPNGRDGEILFGEIRYTEEDIGKTYYYRISEIIPETPIPNVTCDTTAYIAKLTVVDLGDGVLGAEISYSWFDSIGREIAAEDGAVFRNVYEAETQISLKTEKILTGRQWREGETYEFRLEGIANPADESAPVDTRVFTASAGENDNPVQFTVPYDAGYNEQTWYYSLRETVPDSAVGYDPATGLPFQVPKYPGSRLKVDMTYKRYTGMAAEEMATLALPGEDGILWKMNGIAYDAERHTVIVRLSYDESTYGIRTEMTVDGEPADAQTQITFRNSFTADNTEAVIPVRKTIDGRPWLRNDQFFFTIAAEEGVPLPADQEIMIERGIVNTEPGRSGKFTISYKWDDLKNGDGTYADHREFVYTIREKIDPEAEDAAIVRDENGEIVSYRLDQITYDLHEETVHIVLTDNRDGTMSTTVSFPDHEAGAEPEAAFINTYATELIGFPIGIQKQVNGTAGAGTGTYTFALLDRNEEPVTDEENKPVEIAVDVEQDENAAVEVISGVKIGEGVTVDHPADYTYYLKEVIPDTAAAFSAGGEALEDGEGNPLTYGGATPEQKASADIAWKLDGVTYNTGKVKLSVRISQNPVTYRLEAAVTYSPNRKPAVFGNLYEAEGTIALTAEKELIGRAFGDGETYTIEATPEDGAPFRTADGPQTILTVAAGKDGPETFGTLVFRLDDLTDGSTGRWAAKDFRYRFHEVIPDSAVAYNAEGEKITDEGSPLAYGGATPEQKASADIVWKDRGVVYNAPDQIVTIHVSDPGNGILEVTWGGTQDSETGTWSGTSAEPVNVQFSNIYETTIRAEKQWISRGSEAAGIPEGAEVVFELYADGEPTGKRVTLDGTEDADGEETPWTAAWDQLPVYRLDSAGERVKTEDGQADYDRVAYSVKEVSNTAYLEYAPVTDMVDVAADSKSVIANIQSELEITKVLMLDGEPVDADHALADHGFRIIVSTEIDGTVWYVWQNGEDGYKLKEDVPTAEDGALTLSVNEPLHIFPLPAGTYTVEEADSGLDIEGFTYESTDHPEPAALSDTGASAAVTNHYTTDVYEVTVTKLWNDDSDRDRIRPESVTIELLADGEPVREAVLTADNTTVSEDGNTWTYTFTGLPEKYRGTPIVYTVCEKGVPEAYTVVITGDAETGYQVENTYAPEETEATVKKVWDDAENQDGIRPEELKVTLSDGTEVTLNAENEWTATAEHLPKNADGVEIEYTWTEGELPEGYELTNTGTEGTVTTLTNTHTPEETEATVIKVWDDAEDQDGIRPEELKVTLSDGTEVTLNADNKWTATVEHLPKYADGKEIEYTWTEGELPEGYELTDTAADGTVTTLTNTHVPEETEATVIKVWDDGENQDGIRPKELKVTLSDGTEVTLNAENEWTATVEHLPKNADGVEIEYTWTEGELPEGYELTNTAAEGTVTTLTNTHTPEETEATVIKVWDDAEDQDGIRPKELKVTLSDGTEVTLNADNKWTATVEHLPKNADGVEIAYTWTEGKLPEGYELTNTAAEGTVTTLTNTHVPEETEATVIKVWDDAEDQDGIRPEELKVTLSDGTEVTLNADNKWTATVEHLPKYADGVEIVYTWTEGKLPDGYELTDTAANGTVTTLTNSHTPEETTATVKKVWEDGGNQNRTRPAELKVTLSNGTEVTLNAANQWTATVEHLPKYADGKEIKYTWTESKLPNGYTLSRTQTEGTVTTLTNRLKTLPATGDERITLEVVKIWDDPENPDPPKNTIVTLTANGTVIRSIELSGENNWTAAVTDLPVTLNGQTIVYEWAEHEVAGYCRESITTEGNVTTIVNRRIGIPEPPEGWKPPKKPEKNRMEIDEFDEYQTALGVDVMINHVGDCFD